MVWTVPTVAFYLPIMLVQPGLIFVYLPVLILVGAPSLVELARASRRALTFSAAFLRLALLSNIWLFVLAPEYIAGRPELKVLFWSTIQHSDEHYGSYIRQVKESFAPSDTMILKANWRHGEYYLPEYPVLHSPQPTDGSIYRFAPTGAEATLPNLNLILFDVSSTDPGNITLAQNGLMQSAPLVWLSLRSGEVLVYSNRRADVEKGLKQ
jgi:hypothetical protein